MKDHGWQSFDAHIYLYLACVQLGSKKQPEEEYTEGQYPQKYYQGN